MAAIAPGTHASEADLDLAERVLGAVGVVVRVPEQQLDAVTGLSGSGPAYVFLLAEAMIEAGVLVGLPRDQARVLVTQTLLGSGRLLDAGDDTPEALRAAVTSPGGTTAAGLAELEAHGFRAAVLEAVRAATERSREPRPARRVVSRRPRRNRPPSARRSPRIFRGLTTGDHPHEGGVAEGKARVPTVRSRAS